MDAGHGWLIFAMPPSEIAFHPTDESPVNEVYLLSDDLVADMERLTARGVDFTHVAEERWGTVTRFTLPGGTTIGLYQPKHPTALQRD